MCVVEIHQSIYVGSSKPDCMNRALAVSRPFMFVWIGGQICVCVMICVTGDWVTFEDIVNAYHPLAPELDEVGDNAGQLRCTAYLQLLNFLVKVIINHAGTGLLGFNGVDTIAKKTVHFIYFPTTFVVPREKRGRLGWCLAQLG